MTDKKTESKPPAKRDDARWRGVPDDVDRIDSTRQREAAARTERSKAAKAVKS